jgi:NAD(P)-dependent dehydrogenase (short-subunit alcohol dehydrogenase family)
LISGATAGIGLTTALELANQGATVVGIGRNPEKIAATTAYLRKSTGNENVHFLKADLSSQAEIRLTAAAFIDRFDRLDVLVNNVGAMFIRRKESVDGIEMTWAVNHLGYYLLTAQLLPLIRQTPNARIVHVSSRAHYGAQINFDDPGLSKNYQGFRAYGQSKLANVLFSNELARRLAGTEVTSNALHPGFVATDLSKNNGLIFRLFSKFWQFSAISPKKGARTSVYLASSPEVEGVSGEFFIKEKSVAADPAAYAEDAARRLWDLSAEQTTG